MTSVLVTGSRHASPQHAQLIADALTDAVTGRSGPHLLIHGEASGADALAERAARDLGWNVRGIAAKWTAPCRVECRRGHRRPRADGSDYCPAAGNYRNQELVDLAVQHLPDVRALAFPLPGSRGTWDCVRRAERAGLRVAIHHLSTPTEGA
jgi:hypothetical protein